MRTVARIVRDPEDADDTFQTVLMRVWKDLKKIHRHPNPHACILRICINASYDALRKRARTRRREVSLDASPMLASRAQSPEPSAGSGDVDDDLLRAIAALPRKQAHAVLMRALEDESFDAIGQALGCKSATARSHYSKGKARLRQLLDHPLQKSVKERAK